MSIYVFEYVSELTLFYYVDLLASFSQIVIRIERDYNAWEQKQGHEHNQWRAHKRAVGGQKYYRTLATHKTHTIYKVHVVYYTHSRIKNHVRSLYLP